MPLSSLFRWRERDSHQKKDVRNSTTGTISKGNKENASSDQAYSPVIMYQCTVYFYDILETGSANTEFISRHSRDRI
jgi:hypothetical protein